MLNANAGLTVVLLILVMIFFLVGIRITLTGIADIVHAFRHKCIHNHYENNVK